MHTKYILVPWPESQEYYDCDYPLVIRDIESVDILVEETYYNNTKRKNLFINP